MKQKGFTIMELTIAIMAVSVVSLILVFPFDGNINTVRDTARNSNVNLMANIIKLDQISANKKYRIEKKEVLGIFRGNSMKLPSIESDNHYFYGHSTKKEDFFVVVCSESREKFFIAGTNGGKDDLAVIYQKKACENNSIPVGERFVPIKNSDKELDSYIIYQVI